MSSVGSYPLSSPKRLPPTSRLTHGEKLPLDTPAKKDKMEFNERMMRLGSSASFDSRPVSYHGKSCHQSPVLRKRQLLPNTGSSRNRNNEQSLHRRSMPGNALCLLENRNRDKWDLCDLESSLPRIDMESIENHLRIAGEEEGKRRSDRDEIRRRLALESEEIVEKSGRKPSLHSRLQSSMNLQICFMNETASDSESPGSDTEPKPSHLEQPGSLPLLNIGRKKEVSGSEGFHARQARLQADAREALAQAKELAKLQMSHDKERRRYSRITEMVRNSLEKVGLLLSPDRRRVSRQLLTDLNVAQLQVIVNDLHTHIEELNGKLVGMLLERDELHMMQDSMLVDIEDLSRYLYARESSPHQSLPFIPQSKTLLGKK